MKVTEVAPPITTSAVAPAPAPASPIAEPAAAPAVAKPDISTPDLRLAAYEKKERQLRAMEKQLRQERETMKAEQAKQLDGYIDKKRLTEDPLGTLVENGLSYEQLTNTLLQQPNIVDPTIRALKSQISALEAKLDGQSKAQEAATQKQYDQAVGQIRRNITSLVDTNTEFESIKATGMQEAVVELITQTFNEEGYVMDVAEAAKEVESYLVEEGLKYAQLNKVKSKLQPTPAPESVETKQKQTPTIKTLTNAVAQQGAPRKNSEKDRVERAKLAFQGKLNQG